MDRRVRFPLNRSVSILIDFDEYDNPLRRFAFILERKVIDSRGYHELRVQIPRAFVKRVRDHQERAKLFQWINDKTYRVFYNKGKTRIVIMDTGAIKFKGPRKTYTNQINLKKNTFSTMLSFIDNNFNRNDEITEENTSVTVKGESSDDNDETENDNEENSDIEMSNAAGNNDATASDDNITTEDVKIPEMIMLD